MSRKIFHIKNSFRFLLDQKECTKLGHNLVPFQDRLPFNQLIHSMKINKKY